MRFFLVVMVVLGITGEARGEYDEGMEGVYVEVVVAEAAGEGLSGMLAVAEVLRNRGWNLKGFDGAFRDNRSAFVRRQGAGVIAGARRAVELARGGSDTVEGANLYANLEICDPYWIRHPRVRFVRKIGAHSFYRESR